MSCFEWSRLEEKQTQVAARPDTPEPTTATFMVQVEVVGNLKETAINGKRIEFTVTCYSEIPELST